MESFGKISTLLLSSFIIFSSASCISLNASEESVVLKEITPLPRTIVKQKKVEYEPVYGIMRIVEVTEENGVQKFLVAKAGSVKDGLVAGTEGEIGVDSSFSEIIGTFKIANVSNEFVNCKILTVTHKVTSNAYIRIQTGEKEKESGE